MKAYRKKWLLIIVQTVVFMLLATVMAGAGEKLVISTGSPYELGLVDALAQPFTERYGIEVVCVKNGTGAALKGLREGQFDLVMVHDPEAEAQIVADGFVVERRFFASNDFVIVGPASDPAKIKGRTSVVDAYKRIAKSKSNFISRGDNSGTHVKEMAIWQMAKTKPKGNWYVVTNDFMSASLAKADEIGGYFMTDRSTFLTDRKNVPNLEILSEGDRYLINEYHALVGNPAKYPERNYIAAMTFLGWLTSVEGQRIIATFGIEEYGAPLYFAEAIPSVK